MDNNESLKINFVESDWISIFAFVNLNKNKCEAHGEQNCLQLWNRKKNARKNQINRLESKITY